MDEREKTLESVLNQEGFRKWERGQPTDKTNGFIQYWYKKDNCWELEIYVRKE